MTNQRRGFQIAVILFVMLIAFLLALAIIWWLPLSRPWPNIISLLVAVVIGWRGAHYLDEVGKVGRHDDQT